MTSNLAQRDPRFTLARRKHKIREILKDRPTPLADLQVGKATASVSFRDDECLWGALGKQKAAILKFRAGRWEPPGYKLRDMTVKLSFEETPPDVATSTENPNVFLLERPAPARITGGIKTRTEEKSFTVNPSVPTPMGNFAVGSYQKRSKSEEEEAWIFTSQWESNGQTYQAAIWHENGGKAHKRW